MKNAIKMILVLAIVGLVSGGLLVGVYNYASPLIEKNEENALREAIHKVLPDASSYNKMTKNGITLYEGLDKNGRTVGYAFIAEGNAYQGKIKIITAIDNELESLKGMEVLESSETPGLGAEIMNEPFKGQFRTLSILPGITFTKDKVTKNSEVQAITGATVSTKAVVEILNAEIARIRAAFGK